MEIIESGLAEIERRITSKPGKPGESVYLSHPYVRGLGYDAVLVPEGALCRRLPNGMPRFDFDFVDCKLRPITWDLARRRAGNRDSVRWTSIKEPKLGLEFRDGSFYLPRREQSTPEV